jgi:hypothetical protein
LTFLHGSSWFINPWVDHSRLASVTPDIAPAGFGLIWQSEDFYPFLLLYELAAYGILSAGEVTHSLLMLSDLCRKDHHGVMLSILFYVPAPYQAPVSARRAGVSGQGQEHRGNQKS